MGRGQMKILYTLSGEVIVGKRLGRQLGFPTANLALSDEAVADGVYAVRATVNGKSLNGVANAGTRPTVTDSPKRFLEVYLFDFEGDIYGQTIEVELIAFLRPEQKFESVEALRVQIEKDKSEAEEILKAR